MTQLAADIHLLLVEDNEDDALLIREFLEMAYPPHHSPVDWVADLNSAREKINQVQYDCILLDLTLPDSFGRQTFTTIREWTPQTAVIILSGNQDEELTNQAMAQGAQDFLSKDHIGLETVLPRAIQYACKRQSLIGKINENTEFLNSVLNSMLEALIVLNDHQEIEEINLSGCELLGLERNTARQRLATDFLPKIEEEGESFPVGRWETEVVTGTGEKKTCLISISDRETDHGSRKGKIILLGDITHQKMLEARLLQAQKLESIGTLAAGVAHEINTPVQYVSENLRFIGEEIIPVTDFLRKAGNRFGEMFPKESENFSQGILAETGDIDLEFLLREIPLAIQESRRGLEQVSEIIRSLKQFAHPGEKVKKRKDLNEIIRETVNLSRNEWKYDSEMRLDLPEGPLELECFPGELSQVILNLIINSAQSIRERKKTGDQAPGQITVTARADTFPARSGELFISVEDNGRGVSPENREKIFDPFFTSKPAGVGTGQGLSIALSILHKHNGNLFLADRKNDGPGAKFVFILPSSLGDAKLS